MVRGTQGEGSPRGAQPQTYNDYEAGDVILSADLVLGCDGAYSGVREAMGRKMQLNFGREYISHGYKELNIEAKAGGDFAMSHPEALHIWPRGQFMLIGLPNADGSFTCTLFAPFHDEVDPATGAVVRGMRDIEGDPAAIEEYFAEHFPDVIGLMPDYVEAFQRNPACP